MPLLLYISTVREYGRFRSNWVSFSLTGGELGHRSHLFLQADV